MNNKKYPRITFGIIVLNGEPFTRYCLRSIYPYAYEIIVVEGGHEDSKSVCTSDGHSIDGTLETLYKFKKEEDPEDKLIIVTRNGFWPKKDELGNDRTPQSRAYAERAKGDYLWQIDIDEFYKDEDIVKVIEMITKDPEITVISFPVINFWGDINYTVDSWELRRGLMYVQRIFKWSPNYYYLTHEPPTVVDENKVDLRTKKWITAKKMRRMGIYMYHYSLLFPWQVEQKVKIYRYEKPESCSELIEWAEKNFFRIENPFRVHNIYTSPSWLGRFKGDHPAQVKYMMHDIKEGLLDVKLRKTDDIEELLNSVTYRFRSYLLKIGNWWDLFQRQLKRIKNIPNRLKKIYTKVVK